MAGGHSGSRSTTAISTTTTTNRSSSDGGGLAFTAAAPYCAVVEVVGVKREVGSAMIPMLFDMLRAHIHSSNSGSNSASGSGSISNSSSAAVAATTAATDSKDKVGGVAARFEAVQFLGVSTLHVKQVSIM